MENETTGAPPMVSYFPSYSISGSFSVTLDLLVEHFREFAPSVTLDDGTQTDVASVDALDNAANSLVAKCMEIGSKCVLRDDRFSDKS